MVLVQTNRNSPYLGAILEVFLPVYTLYPA